MNWQHLRTVIWLRWRIRVNQVKKLGGVNAAITVIVVGMLILAAITSFFGAIPVGSTLLHEVSPLVLLAIWDGLALGFIFCWFIGLVTDLQRSESLSTEKFLHLPVTLTGVFVINYLSSWLTLSAVVFVPAMVGLAIGLAMDRGPALLLALPLLAAFYLMVTALTYQLRGWLAALMSNPRRRRSIIFGITFVFILVAQLPNLLNMWAPWHGTKIHDIGQRAVLEQELLAKKQSGEITPAEYLTQVAETRREFDQHSKNLSDQDTARWTNWLVRGNQVVPAGWMPWGVMAAAEGSVWPGLVGVVGMSLIGVASLWRAYGTTIRYYTGQFNQGSGKIKPAKVQPVKVRSPGGANTLLERRVPVVSEYSSAIAMASFRSLLRAPEAKMMLLTPIIMLFIFGSMLFRESMEVDQPIRSVMAIGGVAMTFFGMVQFIGNQFAFDRTGFRVFVLCPSPRRDILIGKNLSMAPLALGMSWVLILAIQILRPMYWDHVIAMVPQSVAMFLIVSIMGNWLSILAPMPVAAGTMKPTNPRVAMILLHVAFTFAMPLVLAPTVLPWLTEYLLVVFKVTSRWPIFLIGSILQLAVVGFVYHLLLGMQGETLQNREKKILEIVAKTGE